MKIIRYADSRDVIHYGAEQADGSARRIAGDIYGAHSVTAEAADVARLLAPITPAQILCIGLNYRQHAAETGARIPERPILFVKGINTAQNPGEPILIPTHLASHEVDYECELAVAIGTSAKNINRASARNQVLG